MPLDEVNRQIITMMAQDARIPLAKVAERLSLSTAAIHQRFRRLQDQGYLKGTRLELDWDLLGLPVSALIFLAVSDGTNLSVAATSVAAVPNVVSVSSVTGEFDLMAEVRARSSAHLGELLDDIRGHVPGRSRTVLVLKTFVEGRLPPLGDDPIARQ